MQDVISRHGLRMRIAVNTRLLQHGKLEGIGWFTLEVFRRMALKHPEHEFIFLFDRPFDARFVFGPNVTAVKMGPPARHPLLYRIWFNWSVPRLLKKHKADVFVSPDGYLSLRTKVPQVAVMHDLNFEHFPEDLPKVHRDYYRSYFPKFARKAARIVTVSEFSKQDIATQYHIDPGKIDVAYNGVSDAFKPTDEQVNHCNGKPYFLSVGSLQPRKNIARLLAAFDKACAESTAEIQLLVVGESFYWNAQMKAAMDAMCYKDRVHFAGRMTQQELCAAYSNAIALAYISYFEGFGIPLVEAMKCACPVLAANATCLPEVGGDAALYCDPFDVDSIAKQLLVLAGSEDVRQRLIAAGKSRVSKFNWNHTEMSVYNSIMHSVNGTS